MKNTVTPPPRAILTKFTLFSITIALILTFTACPAEPPASDSSPITDPKLNGTWGNGGSTFTFNNGNFESVTDSIKMKGTFTTSGNTLTYTITHMWGDSSTFSDKSLQAKWYTKDELNTAGVTTINSTSINTMFTPQTGTYSISGNKLTLTWEGSSPTIWTK